jgi:hypothetical protein
MGLFDDPEEKLKKKQRKCAKNASYAVGGALGLFGLQALWPEKEGAEVITDMFGGLAVCLLVYGLSVLIVMALRRDMALKVNALMTWLVVPIWVAALLVRAANGS